ncbi:MAG TPA: class I SAM-dependent methyltransferase [Anaerolineales bacterium]|nr:class I SAM-dependent methyltransferase [Anaerolineales bacterium]
MENLFLNYDHIAPQYNQRYPSSQLSERGQILLELAKKVEARNILEAGSGTGIWLNMLRSVTGGLYGLDYSMGMIRQAQMQPSSLKLARGSAIRLPYQNDTFDLVYCVDAIHHFVDHQAFVAEAFRVLRPGGALAVIGFDPHDGATHWYIYDYFDGVYETDLRRYPSGTSLLAWMQRAGFQNVSSQLAEHILNVHAGDAVLKDPYLKHTSTSQLALLSQSAYQAGIERIKAAIVAARTRDEKIVFRSDIPVMAYLGYKPE